jgi:isoquinoline 1-oxidoreductase beta subunit
MSSSAYVVDRRGFLKMGAAGATGLFIGFYLPERVEALGTAPESAIALNAWIHVGTDDIVTILIDKSEMGKVF